MSTVVFNRPPRVAGPELPANEVELQDPPELSPPKKPNFTYMLYMLPMMLGMSMSGLSAARPGGNTALTMLGPGMMGLSMLGMGFMMMGRQGGDDSMPADRRDYLRYLSMTRQEVRELIDQQRDAVFWQHPDPDRLTALIDDDRLWERRLDDEDFCRLRVGLGPQRLAAKLTPPATRPVEDLEPLSAISLRRFIEAHQTIGDLPIAVAMTRFSKILLRGDGDAIDAMARAVVAQLATLQSPKEVRIVMCATSNRQHSWEWLKWLPHVHHPSDTDGAGATRLFFETIEEVEALLGLTGEVERSGFQPDMVFDEGEIATVILLDGVPIPGSSQLSTIGLAGTTVIDVGGTFHPNDPDAALSLEVTAGRLRRYRGGEMIDLGYPDSLSTAEAEHLCKRIAGFQPSVIEDDDGDAPLQQDLELPSLLGLGDVRHFDPVVFQRQFVTGEHLDIPIGVRRNGTPLTLSIREGAQGGAGPHGMLVGATGSGKSELLRTLVLSLASTHSPAILNLILVDFKGGATFLGCEKLPHTSAIITNLADELSLVDRMQDAIQGELVRRQEVLRSSGYASLHDYEKARAAGTALEPIPSLLLVIDEFSELLSAKREFADLFVMVGRLGRSLGVHLLLATQRLDEGRIHELLSHLSYRIGLRMFSSSESRSVLGTTAAYEDDLPPGNGYIKAEGNLERFKAAYVSAQLPDANTTSTVLPGSDEMAAEDLIVSFTHDYCPPLFDADTPDIVETVEEPEQDIDISTADTIYKVMLERLSNCGPPARQIWLPPLEDAPSLGSLLPAPSSSTENGINCGVDTFGLLGVPVGIVDNPFEQCYDMLTGDLSGAGGHVAIAGAPQSGKSTLLTSLVLGLSLTHTPRQVQFYCLDFGGGVLGSLRGLPHVGDIANRQDREKVTKTVAQFANLLDHREALFEADGLASIDDYRHRRSRGEYQDDPYGDDIFLLIDGWDTFHSEFLEVEERLPRLVSSGLAYGVHVVATANRWNEFRPWWRDNAGTKFELRMGDRIDSLVDTRAAAGVPKTPGRGLADGGRHYLTAVPRFDGESGGEGLADATKQIVDAVAAGWPGSSAPVVQQLPTSFPSSSLPSPVGGADKRSDLRLPLGIDGDDMEPAWFDFGANPHLLIVGDTGAGKSNALKVVANAIVSSVPSDVGQIVLADYRRKLYSTVPENNRLAFAVSGPALRTMATDLASAFEERVPDSNVTPEQLAERDWWEGKKVFVLVDDYDLLAHGSDSPLQPFEELLASGAEIGLHLIIARAANGVGRAMMDPVWRRLTELNTPMLLLSCPKDEGMISGLRAEHLPAGRGRLIQGRQSPLIQLGLTENEDQARQG